ncbi:hypothetical protein M3Y14_28840 [Bacillus thuringiensis]|uniref:hypothetical protein n=1 Tax=Bacillus thuringiensis TaxID=1428 RepID=UPI0022257AB6|nr:hypothetical protein [Bacillus thuringiensis]UYX52370.1 hypothetical protein M3Y14_28840 [Bacillus thuringiensis]
MEPPIWAALITGIVAITVAFIANKKQDNRWYAECILKMKLDALNDFHMKLIESVESINYFLKEDGRLELQRTLGLTERDPHHSPPKRDYTFVNVTDENVKNYINLTKEKAIVMDEKLLMLKQSYILASIYFSDEENVVLKECLRITQHYEEILSGNIKGFSLDTDVGLLAGIITARSFWDGAYKAINTNQEEAKTIVAKHLYPKRAKKYER